MATALAEAGATLQGVLRIRMYLTSADAAEAVSAVHGEVFARILPAARMVVVAVLLLNPRWRVEVEVDAVIRHEPEHSG